MASSDTDSSGSPRGWTAVDAEEYQTTADASWPHDAPPLIAIVGMGVRLPGGVSSPEDFWKLMIDRRCASGPVPGSRYNIDAFYGVPGEDTQSVVSRNGYFLDDEYLGKADSSFFQTNRYEHGAQDPQQMLLLEVVWECMESAGQVNWRGTEIGSFVGTFGEDWLDLTAKDTQNLNPLHVIGTGDYAVANRVSFEYDLKGPSMTCRTACSSSLVALHEACQAIALGDCPSAIVGGTSLIFTPTMTTNMSQANALSPDGICKTFDADANGYTRGEGICALYIKKLDDAIRDHDPVRGVIRAVATNFDGRTNHIMVPSADGQEALIRKAYRKAHIANPGETAFVECHGTATPVGDVVETTAIANAFERQSMIIGGVKPNIGHTEGAAGLAGLIKGVLALEHKQIPPNIHFATPNPKILFKEAGLTVPVETLPWPQDRKERVSVNCFGVGGTNAHVIVDSADSVLEPRTNTSEGKSLTRRIEQIENYISQKAGSLDDLVYTLSVRREHLQHRAFAVKHKGNSTMSTNFVRADNINHGAKTVAFAFPGQGVQWSGMGAQLMENFTSFKNDMHRMDNVLQGLSNAPEWRICVNLLKSWGITPSTVIGHSSGEFAAAYAANAISLDTAIILAYTRGVVATIAPSDGGMLAVALGRDSVSRYLDNDIVVACENSPKSVTLAGPRCRLERLATNLKNEEPDVLLKLLPVERAYHSPHMATVGAKYEDMTGPHIAMNADAMIPMYSTASGTVITCPSELDAVYWRRSLESPVLFSTAFRDLAISTTDKVHLVIIEIGSNSALRGPMQQILSETTTSYTYCATMKRNEDNIFNIMSVAGTAYLSHLPVDLLAINGAYQGQTVPDLPTYPWQREDTEWTESRLTRQWRLRQFPRHELLGARCLESNDFAPTWRNVLRGDEVPWINEHRMMGIVVFPAVGYVSIVSEAIRQVTGSSDCTIQHLLLMEALVRDESDVEIMTSLRKMTLNATMDSSWYEFIIWSYNGHGWTKHCSGQARAGNDQPPSSNTISAPFDRELTSQTWYRRTQKKGLEYGTRFEGLHDITVDPLRNAARGRVEDKRELHHSYYAIHPTIVDQCLQVALIASDKGVSHYPDKAGMPLYIDRVYLAPGGDSMLVEATTTNPVEENLIGRFRAVSETTGDLVLEMAGMRFLPIPETGFEGKGPKLGTYVEWKPDIRFLTVSHQVPSPVFLDQSMMHGCAKAAFVSMFDMLEAMGTQPVLSPYFIRYKEVLLNIARRLAEGQYNYIPGLQHIREMNQKQRQKIFETLRTEFPDPRVDKFYVDIRRYATEYSNHFADGNDTGSTSLLSSMKSIFEWGLTLHNWNDFLGPLGHTNPRLRILEVGADAGSATATIVNALTTIQGDRLFNNFTVTDPDTACLDALKERFQAVPKMEYKSLDISKDPREQGLIEASYDLVVVCNVLWQTPVLSQPLKNVRSLLAPGGRLLLCEPCSDIPYFDVLMALLPGWWSGVGNDHLEKPYVSVHRWKTELCLAGFSGVDVFAYNAPSPLHSQAVMLSTNPVVDPPRPPISLLCRPEDRYHPWVQGIASHLSCNEYAVQWCLFGEELQTQDVIALLDLETPFMDNLSQLTYDKLKSILASVKRILWVTHSIQMRCLDPRFGQILGLARTLRLELNIDFGTFEVDSFNEDTISTVMQVYQQLGSDIPGSDAREYEFILSQGAVHTGRAILTKVADQLEAKDQFDVYQLDIGTVGDLSTLGWKPIRGREAGPHEVEVKASYMALNFKDLMMSLGVVERTKTMDFSFEVSGIITSVGSQVSDLQVGDKVVLFDPSPTATKGVFPAERVRRIPDKLTMTEAAAIPTAYATSILTLLQIGQLKTGQSVLVHSACGGVGLAAVHICHAIGAIIFASVGSDEKAHYLMETFGIPRSHIFDSHSDLLRASWQCVAPFGKMLEIGKRDILGHGLLDLHGFQNCRSFCGFDLYTVAFKDWRRSGEAIEKGIKYFLDSKYRPAHTVFKVEELETAMRQMQNGQNIGKLIIELPEDDSRLPLLPAPPVFSFQSNASYLLVGGQRGIGRAIVRWMVEYGARYFVFLSRSAGCNEEDQKFSQELQIQGCQVEMIAGSVADLETVERAIGQANYAAANSFLDSFVQYRRGLGLPASGVSLGPVDEMGLMSRQPELLAKAHQTFHHMMGEGDVLKAFQVAVVSAKDDLSSCRPATMIAGLSPAAVTNDPWLQQDARFTTFSISKSDELSAGGIDEAEFQRKIASVKSNPTLLNDGTVVNWIIEALGKQISHHNGQSGEIDEAQYPNLEVDSLMSLQIKHWIRRNADVELSIGAITEARKVGAIATLITDSLRARYGVKENEDGKA
ncbi:hypothetical protein EYZ11_006241 [Aspergillus tanneri]|uniref:Type I Polyketide synthases (Type I PKS) n=1 Tax=Aspergillus tanneri TaxID=1220188 RepID=A0A4S3JID8_9EURO|nr:hypothetical protein EYZ11_006241 [Aspergillus tanneri]